MNEVVVFPPEVKKCQWETFRRLFERQQESHRWNSIIEKIHKWMRKSASTIKTWTKSLCNRAQSICVHSNNEWTRKNSNGIFTNNGASLKMFALCLLSIFFFVNVLLLFFWVVFVVVTMVLLQATITKTGKAIHALAGRSVGVSVDLRILQVWSLFISIPFIMNTTAAMVSSEFCFPHFTRRFTLIVRYTLVTSTATIAAATTAAAAVVVYRECSLFDERFLQSKPI